MLPLEQILMGENTGEKVKMGKKQTTLALVLPFHEYYDKW